MLTPWHDGIFTKIEPVNENTCRFWITIPNLEEINFTPGQFMTFDLPIHEKRHKRWRSYSIASAPDGSNVLEFVIVKLDDGAGTHYLFNEVKVGSTIKIRGPIGGFTLPGQLNKEICFICTGTGIAPFRSMLHHIHQHQIPHKHLHLVFGTRFLDGILYKSEMEKLQKELPAFDYHITLSREKEPNWTGYQGYVHPVYEKLFADKRDAIFYICGWRNMIDEAIERLSAMGYEKRKNIIYESYG